MVSRAGLVAITLVVLCGVVAASSAGRQPPTGTAVYVVRHDPRLCPSPLCGGYWVAIANGARTRCADGLRRPRCYVADAVRAGGSPVGDIAEEALVRGAMDVGRDDLGELVVSAVYAPAGDAMPSGGFYRVTDTGIRCVRAPCFSYRVTQVNGATGTAVSSLDLEAAQATAEGGGASPRRRGDEERALRAGPVRHDPRRRPCLPRAQALPQRAAASRLSTSQATRTSSSVVRKFPTASRSM